MRIRKFTSKVISIALALSLLGIGMVPAKTVCDGSCNCSSKGPQHIVDSMHGGTSNHHLQEPKLNHFLKIGFSDMGCHEDAPKASCDMEAPRHHYALQGPVPSVPWSKNSSTIVFITFVALVHSNEQQSLNPAVSHWVLGRRAPDPLYMQHLSFLC